MSLSKEINMARRTLELEKVTLSLPRELVRYADARAQELATSRSQVISEALAERRAREEDELAREGYAFYAAESTAFAASSISAFSEALGHAG
jgi:metal-responsive CopG/Arc/MetJ family transcriptional regulator